MSAPFSGRTRFVNPDGTLTIAAQQFLSTLFGDTTDWAQTINQNQARPNGLLVNSGTTGGIAIFGGTSSGVGVDGEASTGGVGVKAAATGGGTALQVLGPMTLDGSTFSWHGFPIPAPAGSVATFLRNDGTWVDPLGGKSIGNSSGNIPLSNGTVNANLNADMVDGLHAVSFALQANVAKALVYQTVVTPSSTVIAGYLEVKSEDGTIGPVAIPYCNLP